MKTACAAGNGEPPRPVVRLDSSDRWPDYWVQKTQASWTVSIVAIPKLDWLLPTGNDVSKWAEKIPKSTICFRVNWILIRAKVKIGSVTGNSCWVSAQVKTIRHSWPPTVGLTKAIIIISPIELRDASTSSNHNANTFTPARHSPYQIARVNTNRLELGR